MHGDHTGAQGAHIQSQRIGRRIDDGRRRQACERAVGRPAHNPLLRAAHLPQSAVLDVASLLVNHAHGIVGIELQAVEEERQLHRSPRLDHSRHIHTGIAIVIAVVSLFEEPQAERTGIRHLSLIIDRYTSLHAVAIDGPSGAVADRHRHAP